jgi:hypothetical protein
MLLAPLLGNKVPDINKLQEFFYQLSLDRIQSLTKYLDQLDKDVLEDISDLDWSKFSVFYNLGGIFSVFLEQEDLLSKLKSCFD